MGVQIQINNSADPASDYIGWAPSPCRIISTDAADRTVVLRNQDPNHGGQIVFMPAADGDPQGQLEVLLPANGRVDIFIAGRFDQSGANPRGYPSSKDKDAVIAATDKSSGSLIATQALMVRVRKNANLITAGERDRFLSAIVRYNQQGSFADFQNRHSDAALFEIHGRSCFLPWHRAFLLDLERQLQLIDPSVTIPYWKFDEPAPSVFIRDFMGEPVNGGIVDFTNTNPLINWKVQVRGTGNVRISRIPRFDTATEKSLVINDEASTLGLGKLFFGFGRNVEGDPHGNAHSSFDGQIVDIGAAPADPLFFLLHANVDRLWAKWQVQLKRFTPTDTKSYPNQGTGVRNTATREKRIGNFTQDTMWPWDGDITAPRPPSAPGGLFPGSGAASGPGVKPVVSTMIDYQGRSSAALNLAFDYDDVPFA